MRATTTSDGARRPRLSWRTAVLAALVLFGSLAYLHLAARKFEWWRQTRFAGAVAAKEARWRETDAIVPEADALAEPRKCRFLLQIATQSGTESHEVTPEVFRQARLGDRIEKVAGSYQVRRMPADAPRPGEP